ncbi:MAG: hypothetical protein NZ935_06850 [Planctomycetes bacterium]|nr:hypothetical protein [Planctomycetota bacterium]
MMFQSARLIPVSVALLLACGCNVLTQPDRAFVNNQEVIGYAAKAAGYTIDEELYTLQRVEIEWDTATFYYSGAADPREDAWVLRFSPKAGEQDPVALEDVYSHLSLIEGLRDDFQVGIDEKETLGESRLRYVCYSYNSKTRDKEGRPIRGYGIISTYSSRSDDLPVIYAMKIEAVGRKAFYSRADLDPFLRPALRR